MRISDRRFKFVAIGISVLLWGIVGAGCSRAPEPPRGETVRVERVVSGQTIEIVDRTADIPVLRRVRLIGISAPDLRQDPWGSQAQQKLEELCQGQQVLLEWDEKKEDRYDRLIAYAWLDGLLLNEELVKGGYALADGGIYNTKHRRRLEYAQRWARIMGLGIWNPQQPMRLTPREFRNQPD